jgi:uncharacterized protein (DUF1800 family)
MRFTGGLALAKQYASAPWAEAFRAPMAVFLCLSLAVPPSMALEGPQPGPADRIAGKSQSQPHPSARQGYQSGQLRGDERILHALNRFTFGTRPGDLEAVRSIGLEKWFDQQLRPETLDNSDLDARLAQFPAMQQSPQELLFRLPSNAVIRQAIDGKAPIPEQRALKAIYENQIARVELKRQENDRKKQELTSVSGIGPAGGPAVNATAGGESAAATIKPGQESQQSSAPAQAAMASTENTADVPAFDPSAIAVILALPPQQRVARLAAMRQPEFDGFRKALKPQQRIALVAGLNPAQREFVAALENPQRLVVEELAGQRLTRDIYSNAQLQEVMTDFWLNHFNVYLHKNEETPYYLVSYERDVIRPLALGKFEDLLEATAHSPAMLLYLDNSSSMGPDSAAAERNKEKAARNPGAAKKAPDGLNENYARELMELHTLGVNGGYTQADVTQVARVFTGWTVDRPQRGGGFKFDENRHEPGTKKVLGQKIKEHGEQEGQQVLHMLATRPATAQFLSHKLAVRFVGDDPPRSLVDRMARSYLASGGDISAVLKTLFHSPEFWSTDAYRAKVKTPIEYVVSAARAGNATIDNMQPLINALQSAGMPLYGAVPPTGYDWHSSAWVSTGALVNRMNFALALAANRLPGISIPWNAPAVGLTAQPAEIPQDAAVSANPPISTLSGAAPTPVIEEQRLESLLVVGGVSESTRAAVLEQFEKQNAQSTAPGQPMPVSAKPKTPAQAAAALEKQDQLLAGLLLGSPEFQRR